MGRDSSRIAGYQRRPEEEVEVVPEPTEQLIEEVSKYSMVIHLDILGSIYICSSASDCDLKQWLQDRKIITKLVQQHLLRAVLDEATSGLKTELNVYSKLATKYILNCSHTCNRQWHLVLIRIWPSNFLDHILFFNVTDH
jgi:hypothetical protein